MAAAWGWEVGMGTPLPPDEMDHKMRRILGPRRPAPAHRGDRGKWLLDAHSAVRRAPERTRTSGLKLRILSRGRCRSSSAARCDSGSLEKRSEPSDATLMASVFVSLAGGAKGLRISIADLTDGWQTSPPKIGAILAALHHRSAAIASG